MASVVLTSDGLSVIYEDTVATQALHQISLSLAKHETLGIIGESGSGKSTLALAVMGLLGKNARRAGRIIYKDTVLTDLKEHEYDKYRWKQIAIVFQNGLDVLNPLMTAGDQIAETLLLHLQVSKPAAQQRVHELLAMVGLEAFYKDAFPHQLSGGMRQKVLIAMALACQAEVLLVDEPTMALDTVSRREIVALLKRLQHEQGFSMLVISHDLSVVRELTTRIAVMYAGQIVEEGSTEMIIKHPQHPYTRGLIYSSPALYPYRDLWGIPGEFANAPGDICPFNTRCHQAIDRCFSERPLLSDSGSGRRVACHRGGIITLLVAENISKHYRVGNQMIAACRNCSFRIRAGEVAAVIGQSGSGKTTAAEILAGVLSADSGTVMFDDRPVSGNSETSRKGGIQIVFQDPFSSIDERLTIEQIVREPLDIMKDGSRAERRNAVIKALSEVQLPSTDAFLSRRGHTLSGGQRQRLAIARALVMEPRLLIADEISAMLDPSTGANLLRHLKSLQNQKGFSMLYITHDLSLAQKVADWVYVMRDGEIVEQGSASDIFDRPDHAYTRVLVKGESAVPEGVPHAPGDHLRATADGAGGDR